MKYLTFFCFCVLNLLPGCAQQDSLRSVPTSYGVDATHKLAVVHKSIQDKIITQTGGEPVISLGAFTFKPIGKMPYGDSKGPYKVLREQDTFDLYTTALPIIKINSNVSIVDEPKRPAHFSYSDASEYFENAVAIEHRGNSALKYPKKSYDLELRKDSLSEESIDYTFGNLREDDDWILNSVYNEPLKLRSYFSAKLWLDIQQLSYQEDEPKAKSFNDMLFAEVFLNGEYQGVYLLSEQVDRKLLQLKKIKGDTVRGELYKGGSYKDGTAFKAAPEFNNAFPHWAGFEIEYPYENYEAHWDNLHEFIGFVANSTDVAFKNEIANYLAIDNAIDYFLFINLLRGTDNMSKNYFLAKYKQGEPYFFVPWDLDGVLGTIQDGKRIATTNDILTNNLFDRLKATDAANYKTRVQQRWLQLREGTYSNDALFSRMDAIYFGMREHHIYERDAAIWGRNETVASDYEYITQWLKDRLEYLDTFFATFDE